MMIDEETLRLFEANTAFRHGGDAERLRLEHKPEGVASVMDIPYVGESDPSHDVLHKLDVHRPADISTKKPLPVIVDFHGGGLYHGDKRNTTCRDMLFAKHGFAVVNANYRLVACGCGPRIGLDCQALRGTRVRHDASIHYRGFRGHVA